MDKQVVSKKRVADHGEVFTSAREVNAMLDLVKQETARIESRFIHGDALTLKMADEAQPITFSEWSFHGSMVKRRDFTFSSLLPEGQPKQRDLFFQGMEKSNLGEDVFLPKETYSYPSVHFLKIGDV